MSHVALTITVLAVSVPLYERLLGTKPVLDLQVPVNAVAEVLLPGGSATSSGQAPTG